MESGTSEMEAGESKKLFVKILGQLKIKKGLKIL